MKILKDETYNELKERVQLVEALEEECKRLATLITAEVKDCKIGPWCKDCKHQGRDVSQVHGFNLWMGEYVAQEGGQVFYCKKHLHELCPEYEGVRI